MNAQQTKDRLAGTKVQNLSFEGVSIIDASENQPLYDEISGDDLVIPAGYLIVLKDGDDTEVKLGTGKVWSEAISISSSTPAPSPIPEVPAEGDFTLESSNGEVSWVEKA